MEVFWKLFIARMKMFLRQRGSLFWRLFFPLMFILIFGLFNFDRMSVSTVYVQDNAKSDLSKQLIDNLGEIEILEIDDSYSSVDGAKEEVLDGNLDFVFVIPENFTLPQVATDQVEVQGIPMGEAMPTPQIDAMKVYYDQTNVQLNGLVFSLLDQFMSGMNMQIASTPKLFSVETEAIETKDIKYIDIIVPGMIGMSLMQGGLFGIAMGIVTFREKGTLRKLMSTPLKIRDFLMAFVAANMVLSFIQMSVILILSVFVFDVNIFGNIFLLYLVGFIGQLIFLALGFVISGIAKTVDMAQGMVQVISMPMMFLSGVFFSKEALPEWVQGIVQYFPLTPFIDAMRKVALQSENLAGLQTELIYMGAWLVIATFLALKFFRFERE